MAIHIRRREFLVTLLGGAAVCPLSAWGAAAGKVVADWLHHPRTQSALHALFESLQELATWRGRTEAGLSEAKSLAT